jgi:hypothetical protein
MKTFILSASLFASAIINAQENKFEETVAFIKKKVSCCAVPFSASTKRKIDFIDIRKNGEMTLRYSDNKLKQTYNLLDLYKEKEGETGIDTVMGGKFVQFYVHSEKIRMIRFASAKDAGEVYAAFLRLLPLLSGQKTTSSLNFQESITYINNWLSIWSENPHTVRLKASQNGMAIITGREGQSFSFNLFDLKGGGDTEAGNNGIETISCNPKDHAPLAWINFYADSRKEAFIRLRCNTPKSELDKIREAFIHLRSRCNPSNNQIQPPAGASHFVSRKAIFTTNNELLLTSIRPVDKMDKGDTTISILSYGEGWLDKDSLPVGQWNFYTSTKESREYLFKSGTYQRTNPEMFEVNNIDSADLKNNYGMEFRQLQELQSEHVPFIKSNEWRYYHTNGQLWKKLDYLQKQIPVNTSIVMQDPENSETTLLTIASKSDPDEWIKGEVREYDQEGRLYKKLQYRQSGEVAQKTIYGETGKIIRNETSRPFESQVLSTNY